VKSITRLSSSLARFPSSPRALRCGFRSWPQPKAAANPPLRPAGRRDQTRGGPTALPVMVPDPRMLFLGIPGAEESPGSGFGRGFSQCCSCGEQRVGGVDAEQTDGQGEFRTRPSVRRAAVPGCRGNSRWWFYRKPKDRTCEGAWRQTLEVRETGAGTCSPGSVLLLGSRQRSVCLPGRECISLTAWLSYVLEEEFIIIIINNYYILL